MIIQRLRLNLFSSLLAIISFSTGLITAPSKLHSTHHLQSHMLLQKCPKQATRLSSTSNSNLLFKFRTASSEGFGTRARNVATTCQVGDIVVPLCGDLEKRQQLVGRGVYPGVEYLICDFVHEQSDDDNSEHAKDRIASIRPAYPLRAHLERSDWPITVPLSDVPLWLSKTTYEAGTALGTLMLAGTYLVMAAIAATMVRIAVIPSESMIPALMPGDVVLVTRSIIPPKAGDVVFFDPPAQLDEAIANSKIGRAAKAASTEAGAAPTPSIVSTKGKQFIKRVVGVPGEMVGVYNSNPYVTLCNKNSDECKFRVDVTGEYSRPDIFSDESWNRMTPTLNANFGNTKVGEQSSVLGTDEFFVAGDNGYRSVDSRVWGPLQRKYVFGTAQFVVFPPEHAGRIPSGNMVIKDTI